MNARYTQSAPRYAARDTGPSYEQLLADVRAAGMISTTTSIEVVPSATNDGLIIVKAICIMPPLRDGDRERTFSGIGAAYPKKTGAGVIHGVSNPQYYMHTAESRAKKRAWQDALGRGDGLEEDVRQEVMADRARAVGAIPATVVAAAPSLPAPTTPVSNPDAIITEEIAQRLVNITDGALEIEVARQLTRAEAAHYFRQWNEQNRSER